MSFFIGYMLGLGLGLLIAWNEKQQPEWVKLQYQKWRNKIKQWLDI